MVWKYGRHPVCVAATAEIRRGKNQEEETNHSYKLETVSIAEPLQNRQHAPLMLSTLGREGEVGKEVGREG